MQDKINTVIPSHLIELLNKLKGMAPQTTEGVLSERDAEQAAKDLALSKSSANRLNYPEAPQRSVLPDETKFEATPYGSSVGLMTAGLVAQKNANVEAANEDLQQKAWFEKMRDASDIYKSDRSIDRQAQADEERMKRLEAQGISRAELETQRQTGRKELIGVKGEQQLALAAQRAQAQMELQAVKDKMHKEYKSYSQEKQQKLDDYVTEAMKKDGVTKETATPDQMVTYFEKAKKHEFGETPKVGSGLPAYNERPGIKATANKIQSEENVNNLLENSLAREVLKKYTKDDMTQSDLLDAAGNPVQMQDVVDEVRDKIKDKNNKVAYSYQDIISFVKRLKNLR